MFDAHVPDKYRDQAPRVVEEADGVAAVVLRRHPRPEPRAQRGRGQAAARCSTSTRSRYDDMRPGCYDVHERVRDMSAGGQLAGLELPELDRLLGPGAEPGSRPRRQPRDDQGLQRLARRRVVRRVPRAVHPVRHPPAVRRRASRGARCTASPARAATRSRSRRTPPASACRHPHRRLGPAVRRVLRHRHRAVLPRRFVVEVGARRRPTRRRRCR